MKYIPPTIATIETHKLNPKSDLARIIAAMRALSNIGFTTGVFESCCRSCASIGEVREDETGQAWLFQLRGERVPYGFTRSGYIKGEAHLYWDGDVTLIALAFELQGLGASCTGADQAVTLTSARDK